MNRENYDPKALSTFDIVGSYILDVFYNDLYIKANDRVKEGRYASLTEAYKANIVNYMHGIKRKELYMQVCRSLHEYYQRVTVYSTLTFSDFENKILEQFIPPEYFRDFTEKDKDANLCAIITRTVQEFAEHTLEPESLRRIIDDHKNQQNIPLFQDIIVDILKMKREEYYLQFVKKINQRSGKISEEVVKAMKEKIVDETRKRCSAEQDKDRALGIIKQLVQKIADLENKIIKLESTAPATQEHSLQDYLLADSRTVDKRNETTPSSKSRRSSPRTTTPQTRRKTSPVEPEPESESDESDDEDINTKQKALLAKRVSDRAQKRANSPLKEASSPKIADTEDHAEQTTDAIPPKHNTTGDIDDDPGFSGF